MSRALLLLTPLYAGAVAAKNLAWDHGWLRPEQLRWPVISIGNLSVGGSGKTPLVIRLAELLRERGIAIDVLSRGYGRRSVTVARVDPSGSADEFGDEPLLIARATGVPVIVEGSRYAAGKLAECDAAAPRVHLLDDGFQHRRLARSVDIVVLHRSDFSTPLLPAGRLRERFSSLRRAQIVAMREEDRDLEPELRRRGYDHPIWWMTRRLEMPGVFTAIAFCAIARPQEFLAEIRRQGTTLAATRFWRDHHRFRDGDISELLELRRQHQTDAFLTTEKDLVRLTAAQRQALQKSAPLHAAKLSVRLHDESAAIAQLLGFLPQTAAIRPQST